LACIGREAAMSSILGNVLSCIRRCSP
jgi:hypothetical protein